ncbi:MAG: hypothetical protein ACYTFY_15610 [Planctomycetota bacterium]
MSATKNVKRKTQVISKLPCPSCGEYLEITHDNCIFCGHAVNFYQAAKDLEKKNVESIRKYREKLHAQERKGSVGVGLIFGFLSLIILTASFGAALAVESIVDNFFMIGIGTILGFAGIVFSIKNIFQPPQK